VHEAIQVVIRPLVRDQPALTVQELRTRIATETGVRVRVPTLCRVLQRLGWPRQKILHASERNTERVQQARADDRERIAPLDLEPLWRRVAPS
jgi:transposase